MLWLPVVLAALVSPFPDVTYTIRVRHPVVRIVADSRASPAVRNLRERWEAGG